MTGAGLACLSAMGLNLRSTFRLAQGTQDTQDAQDTEEARVVPVSLVSHDHRPERLESR